MQQSLPYSFAMWFRPWKTVSIWSQSLHTNAKSEGIVADSGHMPCLDIACKCYRRHQTGPPSAEEGTRTRPPYSLTAKPTGVRVQFVKNVRCRLRVGSQNLFVDGGYF